jgi:hypothetical protein
MRTHRHADVLDADEAELWDDVRAARSRHHGERSGAIREVAARRGLDPGELNATIADLKRRLVESGAVPAERFFVINPSAGKPTVASAPDGSSRCDELAGRGIEFESGRYARNGVAALEVLDSVGVTDRAVFAQQLEAAADLDAGDRTDIWEDRWGHTETLKEGRELTLTRSADTCGFHLTGEPYVLWVGTPAHARWIAAAVRAGHVDGVAAGT